MMLITVFTFKIIEFSRNTSPPHFFNCESVSTGKCDYMQQMVIILHYIGLYTVPIMSCIA